MTTKVTTRYAITSTVYCKDQEPDHSEGTFIDARDLLEALDDIIHKTDLAKFTVTVLVGHGTTHTKETK